jgi:hypothetical protein
MPHTLTAEKAFPPPLAFAPLYKLEVKSNDPSHIASYFKIGLINQEPLHKWCIYKNTHWPHLQHIYAVALLQSYGETCTTYRDMILPDNCHQSLLSGYLTYKTLMCNECYMWQTSVSWKKTFSAPSLNMASKSIILTAICWIKMHGNWIMAQ